MAGSNTKINIAKTQSPPSHKRTTSIGSEAKSNKKTTIPTTPRSMDKQRKIIANQLRVEMNDNIRLKAHNRSLKEANRDFLDEFASKDIEF